MGNAGRPKFAALSAKFLPAKTKSEHTRLRFTLRARNTVDATNLIVFWNDVDTARSDLFLKSEFYSGCLNHARIIVSDSY